MDKAVVLLSGGLDSCVSLAVALQKGFECSALTISYGQKHNREVQSAINIVNFYSLKEHKLIEINLPSVSQSALTDLNIKVPKDRGPQSSGQEVPVTYVHGRNAIFLSIALSYAECIGASNIVIGANVIDYSGYPDCRLEFLEAFEKMASLGTVSGVSGHNFKIFAPLIEMTKKEIVIEGVRLSAPLSLTWSCYDPEVDSPCHLCEACRLRAAGFDEAGVVDLVC